MGENKDKILGETENPVAQKKHTKRRGRRKGSAKAVIIALAIIIVVLSASYFGVAMYFGTHFLYNTKINGVDFSLKNIEEVEDYMKQQVAGYSLTLVELKGRKEVINGADISIEYTSADELKQLMDKQENYLWVKSFWNPIRIKAQIGVKYDEAKLSEVLASLKCTDKEEQIAPVNAYPAFKNDKYEIIPEVVGTKIDEEKFQAAVAEAIGGFKKSVNLSQAGCYILPKFVSDSPEVIEATDKLNKYIGASITYEFGNRTEKVDSSMIVDWLKVNKKKMKVSFDKEKVQEFVQSLADKYNTKSKSKKFVTAKGDTVTVEGGSFGWEIAKADEYSKLINDIRNGKTISREPEYASRGVDYGNGGVGNTYAEVDLTNQHMYYIKNGKVVLETDVVTGNPNKGNATPQGIYTLSYKTQDAVLRGQRKPDGTYEYETPVKYWMPFNGGIGFHDATWQPEFGGERYKSHGSHGCVNMPKEKAKELYGLISAGIPVVCHF